MSKTAKPAAPQATDAPPPKKSKKKLILIIVAVLLLIGGGAAAFLLMKPAPSANPEILHRINMLLQSKRPSELASFDGKEKLAQQIKGQVEYVLGLRKTAPVITGPEAPGTEGEHAAQSAPAETHADKSGISDVLFTSFIIQ